MTKLLPLEQQVLSMILEGEVEELAIFREQLKAASVTEREMTGVGFYTTFKIPKELKRISSKASIKLGDVVAEIVGLNHGAGFLLYIENGSLHMLEGYCYDEPWPEEASNFKLRHMSSDNRIESIKNELLGINVTRVSPS